MTAPLLDAVRAALTDAVLEAADTAYQDADCRDAARAAEGMENIDDVLPPEAMRDVIMAALTPLLSAEAARRALAEEARDALIVELQDTLNQACSDDERVDSMALSAYADGLRLLSRLGFFTIERESGRRVIGQWNVDALNKLSAGGPEHG